MTNLKRNEAFKLATQMFGDWRGWNRSHHLAYGLIRGVAYSRMEKWSFDEPSYWCIWKLLQQLNAWSASAASTSREELHALERAQFDEVKSLIAWVKKPPHAKRHRPNACTHMAAAQ